jgi:hypothetical protein
MSVDRELKAEGVKYVCCTHDYIVCPILLAQLYTLLHLKVYQIPTTREMQPNFSQQGISCGKAQTFPDRMNP